MDVALCGECGLNLMKNIATVCNEENDNATDGIDEKLDESPVTFQLTVGMGKEPKSDIMV